jgi:hypothetical protein
LESAAAIGVTARGDFETCVVVFVVGRVGSFLLGTWSRAHGCLAAPLWDDLVLAAAMSAAIPVITVSLVSENSLSAMLDVRLEQRLLARLLLCTAHDEDM